MVTIIHIIGLILVAYDDSTVLIEMLSSSIDYIRSIHLKITNHPKSHFFYLFFVLVAIH